MQNNQIVSLIRDYMPHWQKLALSIIDELTDIGIFLFAVLDCLVFLDVLFGTLFGSFCFIWRLRIFGSVYLLFSPEVDEGSHSNDNGKDGMTTSVMSPQEVWTILADLYNKQVEFTIGNIKQMPGTLRTAGRGRGEALC